MEGDECLEFRVRKRDLATLAETIEISESFHCQQRSKLNGIEGLCILLRWFAYPCRYSDMTDMLPHFGRSVPVLGMATDTVLDEICDNHEHLLTGCNPNLLSAQALGVYAQVTVRKESPL